MIHNNYNLNSLKIQNKLRAKKKNLELLNKFQNRKMT